MGSRHQVRPVCPYWLRVNAADRSGEDCDGHACSFTGVHNRSLGEDLENIIYWLVPNDDFGYMVPIIPPLSGEVLSLHKTHIQCYCPTLHFTCLFLRIVAIT